MSDQSGLNTPPLGGQHFGTPAGPSYSSQPYAGQDGYVHGYTGADFPAPAGVTTLQPAPVAPKQSNRLGTVIAASALSAVLGVGAGIGSYAYFSGGGSVASPITVTTQQAADSPKLNGTISAAAEKIQPSV